MICKQQHLPISWGASTQLAHVPSDIIVQVGGDSFSLHRLPLTSRCGLIKMLVVEQSWEGDETSSVELEGVPGGAEAFELAAKFCYGVCLEISKHNVALLRCVAEFLDMSEEHGEDNLVSQTERYLERLGTKTFKDIVATLQSCESLLPMAEDLKIVSRCIDWVATKAVIGLDDQQLAEGEWNCQLSLIAPLPDLQAQMMISPSHHFEWWVEDISILRINFFQRVLSAMRVKGLSSEGVGGALVFYAQKCLIGLHTKKALSLRESANILQGHEYKSKLSNATSTTVEHHEQRVLVETIVSLLPREKKVTSINFLIGLLRTAYVLGTTLACRLDLEKRIGAQLHKATLDDLLIPSVGKCDGETLFDIDIVHRLIASFIEHHQENEDDLEDNCNMQLDVDQADADQGLTKYSPTQVNPMLKVSKLLDRYLAEIAPDANLSLPKFIALAELIPEYARPVEDGFYRAIDVYLKAHPCLTDVERRKVCRLLAFQKLSQEACTHAAQNERLPVQAVVQVLYFEQLRIRNVMAGVYHLPDRSSTSPDDHDHPLAPVQLQLAAGGAELANQKELYVRMNSMCNSISTRSHHGIDHKNVSNTVGAPLSAISLLPEDHYACVRRENKELKLEVARMRMRLSDLEKDHLQYMKLDMDHQRSGAGQYHSRTLHGLHGFFHAFSKSISKLNSFHHHKLNPFNHHRHSHQHVTSHSQPEPHERAPGSDQPGAVSSASASCSYSQASSLEIPKKDRSGRHKRHSLS